MRLRKSDYGMSILAALSFVGSFLVPYLVIARVVDAVVPWSHHTDAGLLLGPLAFIVALPCAWIGARFFLLYASRRSGQQYVEETFRYFALFVFGSFAITTVIGSISSRAFITVPTLLLSLAGAYLAARVMTLRKIAGR